MPSCPKHVLAITESLKTTKESHPTKKTFKCYDGDPEREQIVGNIEGYTKWETGYNVCLYFRKTKNISRLKEKRGTIEVCAPVKFESTCPIMNAEQVDVAMKLTTMKKRTFLSKKYNA